MCGIIVSTEDINENADKYLKNTGQDFSFYRNT